jgi:hypothetical protein
MLDGHLPHRTNLSGGLSPRTQGYVKSPSLAQRMHCLLMCIPAPSATDPSCTTRLRELKHCATARGEVQCSPQHCSHGSRACRVTAVTSWGSRNAVVIMHT